MDAAIPLAALASILVTQAGLSSAGGNSSAKLVLLDRAMEALGGATPDTYYLMRRRKRITKESSYMSWRNGLYRATVDLLTMEGLNAEDARREAKETIASHVIGKDRSVDARMSDPCSPGPIQCDDVVQSINGRCNNLKHPLWGSSGVPMRRLRRAAYTVRSRRFARQQAVMPNPRTLSRQFHLDFDLPSVAVTHMTTQMGQFIDHDLTLTPEEHEDRCCEQPQRPTCMAIEVEDGDEFFSHESCLEFSRSTTWCEENGGDREQMNSVTAFVDASNVYGSTEEKAAMLREFSGGRLLVDENGLLPKIGNERMAGDQRALEMPGLASVHTLFVREHNRIAQRILDGPNAPMGAEVDEEVYQRARRVVIAEMQNIVYSEYLPVVLGPEVMRRYNLWPETRSSLYSTSTDPSIFNAFATAAYRFGHSMIQGLIERYFLTGLGLAESFQLRDVFFDLMKYEQNSGEGMDMLLMGLLNQPAQSNDEFITREVTNHLFQEKGSTFGSDLIARNIQRGRDHGVAGYNKYRKRCRLATVASWDARPEEIESPVWLKLQQVYRNLDDPGNLTQFGALPHGFLRFNPDNRDLAFIYRDREIFLSNLTNFFLGEMDLFSAGVAERPVEDGLVGPTFACIIGKQFRNLKRGDRFFFTHRNLSVSLTSDQVATIRRRTLRDVICENTSIPRAQLNAFRLRDDPDNPDVSCVTTNDLNTDLF